MCHCINHMTLLITTFVCVLCAINAASCDTSSCCSHLRVCQLPTCLLFIRTHTQRHVKEEQAVIRLMLWPESQVPSRPAIQSC